MLIEADPLAAFLSWVRPAWHADALCKEHPDVDFFPGQGADTRQAQSICARCLVQAECLAAALDGREDGIWGGTTGRARQRPKATAIAVPVRLAS